MLWVGEWEDSGLGSLQAVVTAAGRAWALPFLFNRQPCTVYSVVISCIIDIECLGQSRCVFYLPPDMFRCVVCNVRGPSWAHGFYQQWRCTASLCHIDTANQTHVR